MPPQTPITDPDPPTGGSVSPHKPVGPLISIIIILAILIAGAMYFYRSSVTNPANSQVPYIPASTTTLPIATTTE